MEERPRRRSQGEGLGVEGLSVEMPKGPGFISGVPAPDENLSFHPNYPKAFDGNKTPWLPGDSWDHWLWEKGCESWAEIWAHPKQIINYPTTVYWLEHDGLENFLFFETFPYIYIVIVPLSLSLSFLALNPGTKTLEKKRGSEFAAGSGDGKTGRWQLWGDGPVPTPRGKDPGEIQGSWQPRKEEWAMSWRPPIQVKWTVYNNSILQ